MTTIEDLTIARNAAAQAIFKSGTVKVDLENGFVLRVHDKYPDAPRSPIYLSLRPKNVKDGRLSLSDFLYLGISLSMKVQLENLLEDKTWIAGIPAAGDPLVDALQICNNDLPTRLLLQKIEVPGQQKSFALKEQSINGTTKHGDKVLLIDDLVTEAGTTLKAIETIRSTGAEVTDLLVFLDRSYDAEDLLLRHGVKLHAVWQFDDLMDFALFNHYLNRTQCDTIAEYPHKLRRYMQQTA